MTVTDIRKTFNSRSKSDIFADGEFMASLYNSDIKRLSLSIGCELSAEKRAEIDKTVRKNAHNDALRLIMRADYPSKLIYEKLVFKKHPKNVAKEVVADLISKGYIDDYAYAEKFASAAFSSGKKGKAYVSMELSRRGIDRETIEELCERYYEGDGIDTIAENKFKTILKGNKPDFKDFMKLKNYLLRQGFSFEETESAINRIKEKGVADE